MSIEVLMPQMGEGITEATLVKWLKKPGDQVRKEEALLEVSTDKVDTEIPSPASGYIKALLAKEGDTIAINTVIAHIAEEVPTEAEDTTAAMAPSAVPSNTDTEAKRVLAPSQQEATLAGAAIATDLSPALTPALGRVRSSPLVRKIAKQHGIDLTTVQGSGLHGRITRRDLDQALAKPETAPGSAAPSTLSKGTAHLEWGRLETKRENGGAEFLDGVKVRREKMSKMRSLIADHMVRSVRTSPHVTTIFEIDMQACTTLREQAKQKWQEQHGTNLTFTAFFVHAAVQAIKLHPIVNTSVDGDDILWKDSINIGVAVAIDSGLIVPVIKQAGELNLLGIARRINDLATRARTKKLTPEDVQGGTFSVTNPGMFGSLVSSPIINQPQVAILSIGAIIKRPVVINDMIAIRPMVQIGLTFDHRIIDGEAGARFLATYKQILESYSESNL